MRYATWAVFLAAIAVPVLAAETKPASAPATASAPASQAATQGALQAVRYQRTGGFAGTNDVIEITPAGKVVVQGKLMGKAEGELTREQVAALAALFAGWDQYKPSYPAPAGSADGFQVKIRYGTKEVSASEMNASLPEGFTAVRTALEKIAADLKPKQP